jgi:hypothetical protein
VILSAAALVGLAGSSSAYEVWGDYTEVSRNGSIVTFDCVGGGMCFDSPTGGNGPSPGDHIRILMWDNLGNAYWHEAVLMSAEPTPNPQKPDFNANLTGVSYPATH